MPHWLTRAGAKVTCPLPGMLTKPRAWLTKTRRRMISTTMSLIILKPKGRSQLRGKTPTGPNHQAAQNQKTRAAMTTDLQQLSLLNSARTVLSSSTRALRTAGYPEAADRVIRLATTGTPRPVVVFVGESGRGKSSVVNTLASVRDDLPVGSGQGLYRLLAPAGGAGDGGREVWVYPDGSRASDLLPGIHPIGVEIPHAGTLIGDVTLLDAPSAGGLSGPQALLNLKILEAASVAVFVTDAGALLSNAELSYLRLCSDQVEAIGLVVTKTDLYPDSWKDVVAGNAALLKDRLPRLANSFVIGISAEIARAALSVPTPSAQARLAAASGFPHLEEALKRDLARAASAPTANALRLARTGLEAHRQARLTHVMMAEAPAESRAGMIAERQRLSDLKEEQQRWTMDLERDLGELRAGVLRRVGEALDSWSAQWRSHIHSAKALRDAKTTQTLTNDIFAGLQAIRATVITDAEAELRSLIQGVFRGVPLPEILDDILNSSARPTDTIHMGSEKHGAGFDPSLVMSIVMGSSMGTSVAGLLSGGAAWPLALLGAGGWFAVNRFYRQNMLEKNRLLGELPRLAQAERAIITDYLEARLRRLKPEIVVAYRAQLQKSLTELQQLIRESQVQEQLSAQARESQLGSLKREIGQIEGLLADVDSSLVKLRSL